MSRSLSTTATGAVTAQETGEAFLYLVTIDHDDLADPIRVTSDGVPTTSNGRTFEVYPFQITPPADKENEIPSAQLRIDNISGEIMATLRGLTGRPTVSLEVVLGSQPVTLEAGPYTYTVTAISYDAATIDGKLEGDPILVQTLPGHRFTPTLFPGLFKKDPRVD